MNIERPNPEGWVTYEIELEKNTESPCYPSLMATVTLFYSLEFDREKPCPRCEKVGTFCRAVYQDADIEEIEYSDDGELSTETSEEISDQLYQKIVDLAKEKLENDEDLNYVVCLCPSLIEQDEADQIFDDENQLKLIFPDSLD